MEKAVYVLCALASLCCAILLLRSYLRTRVRILMWSAACFGGLAMNNALLLVDRLVLPDLNLSVWRLLPALAGLMILIFGLVMETKG